MFRNQILHTSWLNVTDDDDDEAVDDDVLLLYGCYVWAAMAATAIESNCS